MASTETEPVREPLVAAISEHGVPEGMLMDHGTPWWHGRSAGGMTKLSLWLMRQGIRLHWSGVMHPQTQGKVERFHGALQLVVARRGARAGVQVWLDQFRWEHNHVRPHEALRCRRGLAAATECTAYDASPPRWEYPAGARVLKVDPQGKLTKAGKNWRISDALAGESGAGPVARPPFAGLLLCHPVPRNHCGLQCSTIVEHWIPS